ncbi:MAG: bifunctional (p)ppGpp synthetase/guanosine-3',5'-bis(diphosphate) 3'-pyrophosphohydrolase [Candidatus Pacebacteria bacterium]|nr:bifunctional (p)ppGpp synthetase/guanosine-3',5'-bis(diphosphate) 3'-pyrophosphohydrolase [Candidatus Paceibacterota bacterium]
MKTVKDITSYIDNPSKKDEKLIEEAFNFAVNAHSGQKRYSGEPYFNHVYETGKILAELGMGATVISAGLLHDVVEDGITTEKELKEKFGEDISLLVEGVTKLGKIRFQGLKRHTESLRKLFMASSQDIRVLIIKFADRVHNMKTLDYVPKEKQLRIATETLEIFAPLAYRLGIGVLNRQLEDLSFPYVYPNEYKKVEEIVREETKDSIISLKKIDRSIKKRLAREGITNIHSNSRIKGMYSLYRKLERKHWDIDKIYDIAALRIIVPTKNDCYKVLGIIHDFRRPMPGRIKDYIAFPKPNGYQSLHTTVFTRFGNVVEIQLRTAEMHKEAEYGIASHLSYKDKVVYKETDDPKMWIKRLLSNINKLDNKNKKPENPNTAPEWIKNLADHPNETESQEFISELKKDFFEHRVFVFTPKGDVIDLPTDSSPIDFAFAIHSDVGNHMHGAKVHGKLVSLDTKLKNGDIVDIMTKKTITPTKKWLDIAKTAEARRHIKSTLKKLQEAPK